MKGGMARIRPNNRSFVRNDASRRNLTAVNGLDCLWASNQGRLKESMPACTGGGTGLVLLQLMCYYARLLATCTVSPKVSSKDSRYYSSSKFASFL